MGIKLPVKKAWDGFCDHYDELQKQGRTIAENGVYRITMDAFETAIHILVFQGDEIIYDDEFYTKDQFERELYYLYDLYINGSDKEDEEFEEYAYDEKEEDFEDFEYGNEVEDDGWYISEAPKNASVPVLDELIDNVIMEMSPGSCPGDPFYEELKGDIKIRLEETLLDWGFPVKI